MYAQTSLIYFPRWMTAVPFALGFTVLIFNLMVKLVFTDFVEPLDVEPVTIPDPIFEYEEIETRPEIEKVKKPEAQERPIEPEPIVDEIDGTEITIPSFTLAPIQTQGIGNDFGGMPIAQYQVQPKYPNRAVRSSIEGYVDVSFDITEIGTTENVKVVSAEPVGYFEKNTIAAVKRWRYQPQMKDGKATPYNGMVQRITFQMQK